MLGSTGNYSRGSWEQAHGFGEPPWGGGGGCSHFFFIRRLGPTKNIRNFKHPPKIFEILATPQKYPHSVPKMHRTDP